MWFNKQRAHVSVTEVPKRTCYGSSWMLSFTDIDGVIDVIWSWKLPGYLLFMQSITFTVDNRQVYTANKADLRFLQTYYSIQFHHSKGCQRGNDETIRVALWIPNHLIWIKESRLEFSQFVVVSCKSSQISHFKGSQKSSKRVLEC